MMTIEETQPSRLALEEAFSPVELPKSHAESCRVPAFESPHPHWVGFSVVL